MDRELRQVLASNGFTGKVESTLEQRLGRPLDPAKAELGRLLLFDKFVGFYEDNSCAGCHSPLNRFGDSVSMAIGVENNDFVGPRRAGPRDQRRTPAVVNTAFYPKLMWDGRFRAVSGSRTPDLGIQYPENMIDQETKYWQVQTVFLTMTHVTVFPRDASRTCYCESQSFSRLEGNAS